MVKLNKNLVFLTFFIIILVIITSYIILTSAFRKEKIIIERVEENNYLRENSEFYEKNGIISSTFYVISMDNYRFTCEKLVFRDNKYLSDFLENIKNNFKMLNFKGENYIEIEGKIVAVAARDREFYSCTSYDGVKEETLFLMKKVFRL